MPSSHAGFSVVVRSSALDDGDLVVLRMHTTAALSSLYEVELVVQVAGRDALTDDEIEDVIAGTAYVAFGAEEEHKTHGVLRVVELLPVDDVGLVTYRLVLVPRLWYATQTFRSRVYQEMSVPEIVKSVLVEMGLAEDDDFVLRLTSSYAAREHTVQYEETDLAFISRLLEDEGIFYLFEQGDEGERIVLVDSNDAVVELPGFETIRHDPRAGRTDLEEAISSIRRTRQVVPKALALRDFNWRTPSSAIDADTQVPEGDKGAQVLYADNYRSASEGKRLAKIRAQEIACRRVVFSAVGSVRGLAPGHKFQLTGHVLPELDAQYLVTAITAGAVQSPIDDGGDEASGYRSEIEAILWNVPYRPPRVTPKPRITGVVHGIIDGEHAGTAAPIDDRGCYKVVLPYDTVAEKGGKATRWIRMAQSFGGPTYGIHFPLHIGVEVMIVHLDGDPDRPVIAGVLPNPRTASPASKQNATQSVIRTRAAVHIEIEDDAS